MVTDYKAGILLYQLGTWSRNLYFMTVPDHFKALETTGLKLHGSLCLFLPTLHFLDQRVITVPILRIPKDRDVWKGLTKPRVYTQAYLTHLGNMVSFNSEYLNSFFRHMLKISALGKPRYIRPVWATETLSEIKINFSSIEKQAPSPASCGEVQTTKVVHPPQS